MNLEPEAELVRPTKAAVFAMACASVLLALVVFVCWLSLQTRAGVCSFRSTLETQQTSGQLFLKLTVAQREHDYGKALGHIPESTIRAQIASRQKSIDALDHLYC